MRKSIGIVLLFLISCSQNITEESLVHLNGYWEIKEVSFPDGPVKEYKINPVVDYFSYEGRKGYRKKVKPRMDGTFTVTEDSEKFTLRKDNELFWFQYENQLSSREEQLIQLTENEFVVRSKDGLEYLYQRYNPEKSH